MSSLRQSWHFVPLAKVPRIATTTSFRDVYKALEGAQAGAFLLVENEQPVRYVKAYPLAENVVKATVEDPQKLRLFTSQPIGEIVSEFGFQDPLVPVHSESVDVEAEEAPLRGLAATAIPVQERGFPIGWYLNHEVVREAQTQRTIFICANNHRNTDPDSGSCWLCPAPIVRTAKE